MGGPTTTRVPNSMTAPQPSLTGPSLNLLQSLFSGGNGRNPLGSPGNTAFGNLQNVFGSPLSPGISNTLTNFATGQNPGQNVLNAYQPLFQRNLQEIQGSGPRFSSGNDQLRQRALQDYNAFAGNTLMQGQQQQIGAALGLGGLQNQSQNPLMQQLLSNLFGGGGITTPAVLNQQPGFGQQLAGLAGTIGGALLGVPLGGAAGGSLLGSLFGGGGGSNPSAGLGTGPGLAGWAGQFADNGINPGLWTGQ